MSVNRVTREDVVTVLRENKRLQREVSSLTWRVTRLRGLIGHALRWSTTDFVEKMKAALAEDDESMERHAKTTSTIERLEES